MRRANIFTTDFEYDDADPEGYRAGVVQVSKDLGATELAVKLFEIPAGQSLCPYHYEYVDEWLVVLEGTITVRVPDGELELGRGDTVAFPPGPAGAHKLRAAGEETARIMMFSSAREPAIAVYPDSDKVGVWPGHGAGRWLFRGADANLDYYDGE
jgi:uncharacterized cupin superfamily protein